MENKANYLKERREKLLRDREWAEKRESYGPKILKLINESLKTDINVDDLDFDMKPKLQFKWTLEENPDYVKAGTCPGLNSGYITKSKASNIALCVDSIIGDFQGFLGFSECAYMGHIEVRGVSFTQLFKLAESVEDSIYIYFNNFDGVIMVDYEYDTSSSSEDENDFTVVVQGESLELLLNKCFKVSSHCAISQTLKP